MGYGAVPPKAPGHPELRGESVPDCAFVRLQAAELSSRTRYLDAVERGVWISLVAMMAAAGKPIAEDPKRLTMACGVGDPTKLAKIVEELLGLGLLQREVSGLWADMLGRAP